MPELRRTIRRISSEDIHLADEPRWPVFLALLVFAGFATGTVLVYARFDAEQWHRNAIVWLILIAIAIVGSMIATMWLPPRAVRRTLQLAIVLNLLFHLGLLVASFELNIFGVTYKGDRPSTLRSSRSQARVIADYPSLRNRELQQQLQENERPVETETPVEAREITPEDPSADTREVADKPTPNIPIPSTSDSAATTSLPETPSTRKADSLAESGPAEAQSVRFSETPSLLSRREVKQPDTRIARNVEVVPDLGQAPSSVANNELTARDTDVEKAEAMSAPTLANAPETSFPKATDTARAESSATPSETANSAPSPERQPIAARSVDSSASSLMRPGAASSAESLAPQATETAQAEASSLPGQREVTSPSAGVASSSARAETPRAVASSLPQSDVIAESGNLRRAAENAAPSVAIAAPTSERVTGNAESTALSAASIGSVAQQSGRESPGQMASQSTSEAPSGGAELRAATSARASNNLTGAPADSTSGQALPRAAIASNTPRSSINADAPDVSGGGVEAAGEPTTPTQTAIAQGQSGIAGGGTGVNLERSAPAGASPALVASGMARRDTAAQSAVPGDAFESTSSAAVRRSQGGANAPSTTLRAESGGIGGAQGSERTGELNATSSAALTQSSSQASEGANMPSSGNLDIDLGPTQIVSERGEGRGSGGGAPQVSDRSLDSESRPAFAASRSPGYVPSTLKADAAAGATSPAEGAGSQGVGPAAASLQASQLGGSGTQSLSSLAGREAPGSPGATGPLGSAAPGSKISGGDSPAPSNMADGSAGSPSSRRSTSASPSLAGMKADEIGGGVGVGGAANGQGGASSGGELAATSVGGGGPAKASESNFGMRAGGGAPSETTLATGGGGSGKATTGASTPDSPISGDGPALAVRGKVGDAPSIGLRADDIEAPRNIPSDGTTDPGQGLALAPLTGKGSEVSRQGSESLPALLAAPEGVGGLGAEVGPDAGINRPTAMRDSTNVDDSAVRLARNLGALAPTTVASSSVPKEGFESRGDRLKGSPKAPAAGGAGAPSPETEEAIERGLAYLASIQQRDGRWSLAQPGEDTQINSDTAATALALISFQGAGYTHREHKYKERVAAGLQHLIRNQKRNGDFYSIEDDKSNESAALYSHALATIAICEAYGMTQDPVLKESAERAVAYILACQSPERGGWRYIPQVSSDTSVSGWMLMALKSGQLAGLESPQRAMPGVKRWLDLASAKDSNGSLYVYNSFAGENEKQRHYKEVSLPMTSVGLLMRFYTGWNRDNASMIAGANYLRRSLPDIKNRDTYYWYYGTQVMFHMGGEYWEEWNRALHPMLVGSQVKQGPLGGSWDPNYPVRDRWAAHGGRLYVTTMNLLSLEVYYRHLPLYEETSK